MFVNSLLAGKYFGIRQDYVVVGNGAAELIKSLMERLLAGSSTSKVGVIYPTFEEYPHRLKQEDIVAFQPDNRDLKYTEDDLIAFYTGKGISSLLLINPDNPSGNFISMAGLQKLLAWSKTQQIQLIVDESFVDFSDDFEHNTLLRNETLADNPQLVVMKSISKSYGVPGLRLGILASSDVALIKWIKKDISIWNINSFAEFYMQIFGKYESDYLAACRKFIAERRRFEVLLREIPYMRVLPTQANYFCIELTGKYSSAELTKLLLERYNIMVKDCDSKNGLKGRNFIRISVRSQQDNDQLIAALKELS
jgi:histidinol-phosphate/aromatic aminotransferase/cobyric acid decarboxylase-like protein